MSDIKVQKVAKAEDRAAEVFRKVDEMSARIQQRAYELFAGRSFADGHDLEDWFIAEREICWPASELSEQEKSYVLNVALPGFHADQVTLTATPHEIIVHANAKTERREEGGKKEGQKLLWSQFQSNDVYRRVELAQPIDVSKVTGTLMNGMLKVVAEKSNKAAVKLPVAAAA